MPIKTFINRRSRLKQKTHKQQRSAQAATLKEKQLNTDWLEKLESANFSEADFLFAQSSATEKATWQKQNSRLWGKQSSTGNPLE